MPSWSDPSWAILDALTTQACPLPDPWEATSPPAAEGAGGRKFVDRGSDFSWALMCQSSMAMRRLAGDASTESTCPPRLLRVEAKCLQRSRS